MGAGRLRLRSRQLLPCITNPRKSGGSGLRSASFFVRWHQDGMGHGEKRIFLLLWKSLCLLLKKPLSEKHCLCKLLKIQDENKYFFCLLFLTSTICLSKYHKSVCQSTTNLFVKVPQICLSKYHKSV